MYMYIDVNSTLSSIEIVGIFSKKIIENKRTMMVLYRSPEHICNLYGLSRAGY